MTISFSLQMVHLATNNCLRISSFDLFHDVLKDFIVMQGSDPLMYGIIDALREEKFQSR